MKQKPFAALRGLIVAKFGTHAAFADAMGMSRATLSAKLNGRTEWQGDEVALACKLLGIPLASAHEYDFF
jgi:hypothetical protein